MSMWRSSLRLVLGTALVLALLTGSALPVTGQLEVPRRFTGAVQVNGATPADGTSVMAKNTRTGIEYWDPDGTEGGVYSLLVYGRVTDEVHLFVLGIQAVIDGKYSSVTIGTGDKHCDLSITKAHLVTAITAPTGTETYSTLQPFSLVSATVTNIGQETATDVTAAIDVPNGNAQWGGSQSQAVPDLAPGAWWPVTWPVTCTGADTAPGLTEIVVTPDGDTPDGKSPPGGTIPIPACNLISSTVTITQEEKIHLDVTEVSTDLPNDVIASTQQYFTVTATVRNTWIDTTTLKAEAEGVYTVLAVSAGATILDAEQSDPWAEDLVGNAEATFTWQVQCTDTGSAEFVVTPYGTDENTGQQVVAGNWTSYTLPITQEEKIHLDVLEVSTDLPNDVIASTQQYFTVTATVRNTQGDPLAEKAVAQNVTATLEIIGEVDKVGPEPAAVASLAGDEVGTFSWPVQCTDTGPVEFVVTPYGTDENTLEQVLAGNWTSNTLAITQEEKIHLDVTGVVADLPNVDVASTEQEFTVTATVKNTQFDPLAEKAVAEDVTVELVIVGGGAEKVSGPSPASVATLAGDAEATFSCQVRCTDAVPVELVVIPLGIDENTGEQVLAGNWTSNTLAITQQLKSHLVADITLPDDGAEISLDEVFTVTATISNTGEAGAYDVEATIDLTEGAVLYGGETETKDVADIAGGGSAEISWTLVCTSRLPVTITVTPGGKDVNTEADVLAHNVEDDSVTINQVTPHLIVQITAPVEPVTVTRPARFEVAAVVSNTGEVDAEGVVLTLTVTAGHASLVQGETPGRSIGSLSAGSVSAVVTWTLRCTGEDDATITVTPDGTDVNTGGPIRDKYLEADEVTVYQEPGWLIYLPKIVWPDPTLPKRSRA